MMFYHLYRIQCVSFEFIPSYPKLFEEESWALLFVCFALSLMLRWYLLSFFSIPRALDSQIQTVVIVLQPEIDKELNESNSVATSSWMEDEKRPNFLQQSYLEQLVHEKPQELVFLRPRMQPNRTSTLR